MPTFYQPDPKSNQIVDSTGKPISFAEYKAQGGTAANANIKFADVTAGPPPNLAPTGTDQQTPPGQIGTSTGSLFDYKTVVQQALNEAAAKRKGSQLDTLSPFMAGLPNNALSQVLGSIKQGANLDATSIYKTFSESQDKEAELALQKQQFGLDYLKSVGDGVGDMSDQGLLALSKTTGVDMTSLVGLRVAAKTKNSDAHQLILSQIAENKAQTYKAYHDGNGSNPVSTTYQDRYNLPSNVSEAEYNQVRNLILQNKNASPNTPYYDLWGQLAEELKKHNIEPSTYDGLFWDYLAPTNSKGQSGYDQWAVKSGVKNAPKTTSGITADQIKNVQNQIKSGK